MDFLVGSNLFIIQMILQQGTMGIYKRISRSHEWSIGSYLKGTVKKIYLQVISTLNACKSSSELLKSTDAQTHLR